MSKQRLCQICKKRPPWKYKNCPPNVCKACYHRHVWEDRPAARKQRQGQRTPGALYDVVDDDILLFNDAVAFDDEALVESLTSPEFALPPPLLRDERELHFHIAFQAHDPQRQRDLIQNLERLACTVTMIDTETIAGYLAYNPRFSADRNATAQLHKLLNRWQRKGHLTWTASQKI